MLQKMELHLQAITLMSRTLTGLLDALARSGRIDPEAELIHRWKTTLELLEKQGLHLKTTLPGDPPPEMTTCPGCNAVLRDIKGAGSRCDWCGYVFPSCCPACGKEQSKDGGKAGDVCLWCHHQF